MEEKEKEMLKSQLLNKKKDIEHNPADDYLTRAERIKQLYYAETPRVRDYRGKAKLILDIVKEENNLIEEALKELEQGNPQKAKEVINRPLPKWF